MLKIYVITSGEYSDYGICAVTTDMERAKLLVKYFSNNTYDANIEEYDTDEPVITTAPRKKYRVIISWHGGIKKVKETYTFDPEYRDKFELGNRYQVIGNTYWGGDFIADIVTEDADHAIKIAADERAKMIAERYGL